MARYIDADELEKTLRKMDEGENECLTPMEFKEFVLDYQPTEDVAPVVHAHWEENEDFVGNTVYTCSNCKETFSFELGTPVENNNFYCPHCGAKMDENTKQTPKQGFLEN